MKKVFTFFLASLLITFSMASVPNHESPKNSKMCASEIFVPIGKTGNKISLLELSTISRTDLEKMTGKKMNFLERHAFYSAQNKLKKGIDNDGVVSNKKLQKAFGQGGDGESGFHLGGFALGFLLGLIGVLIAYLIKDDKKPNRVKWAWVGFGVVVVLVLIGTLTAL